MTIDNETLTALSGVQRKAIRMIVEAEVTGLPLSHLLKTPYSCQWCGKVIGRSGIDRDERKALQVQHEEQCERNGQPWKFAANLRTYYHKWQKDPRFVLALDSARSEVVHEAIATASAMLQLNTVTSVRELVRQVTEAEKDSDRRLSAVAILDRADVTTASKGGGGGVQVYLPEVDSE